MTKVFIRFLQDYEKQDDKAGTVDARRYRIGQVLQVRADTARHYERRGIAERISMFAPAILQSQQADSGKTAETDKDPSKASDADDKKDGGKTDDGGAGKGDEKKADSGKEDGKTAEPGKGEAKPTDAAKDGGRKAGKK